MCWRAAFSDLLIGYAQLIDAETGAHLWAERFDKPVADLFDMQDEIVARLANSLGYELVRAEAQKSARTSNLAPPTGTTALPSRC